MTLGLLLAAGCQEGWRSGAWGWSAAEGDREDPVRAADTGFTSSRSSSRSPAGQTPDQRLDIHLRVLRVQIPHTERAAAAALWDPLREDVFDSATQRRLHRNGVRVGVGRTERWAELEAVLSGIEDARRNELPPLRTPPGVPLALELDGKPRDQTIFYLEPDGILSGETWPGSRRVLRVTYTLDAQDVERAFLSVVPEIRLPVVADWLQTEDGWAAGSRRPGRTFAAAAFALALGPQEYVLVGPGEKADVCGLVGGTFLRDTVDGETYDSFLFLRTDIVHVDQRR